MTEIRAATIAAYQAHAAAYAAGTSVLPESVRRDIDAFVGRMGGRGRVLEVGSGSGRDALALEERGLVVHRSDITPAFVELLRAGGHEAAVLDPLVDDLGGPWDGVWSSAALLHLARTDLPVVLRRLREATRPGGRLYLSLKEGDGEAWSTHGNVSAPRHFTYWREEPLREALATAGWTVDEIAHTTSPGDDWLDVFASAGGAATQ